MYVHRNNLQLVCHVRSSVRNDQQHTWRKITVRTFVRVNRKSPLVKVKAEWDKQAEGWMFRPLWRDLLVDGASRERQKRGKSTRWRERSDFIRGSDRRRRADAIKPGNSAQLRVLDGRCYRFPLEYRNDTERDSDRKVAADRQLVRSFPVIYYRCHTSVILSHWPLIARPQLPAMEVFCVPIFLRAIFEPFLSFLCR